MSAYQYPAAPPGAPAASSSDPTAVFGRRCAAVVVDFLLYLLIMSFVTPTPLSPLAEYYEDVPAGVDACEVVRDNEEVSGCLEIGDRVYFTDSGDVVIQFVVWLAVVLAYVLVQGATGYTPGKAIFGLRAVNEQGDAPGFGRSLVRSLLWIVDAAPYCIPGLVAFITGLSTKGHRRVGDMAAKTFVVGKNHTGPVVVPGLTSAGGYPGAPAAYGSATGWSPAPGAPGAPGAPWGAPQGAPPGQPAQPSPWGSPQGAYPPPGGQGQPVSGDWRAPGAAPAPADAPSGEARPAPPYGAAPQTPPTDARSGSFEAPPPSPGAPAPGTPAPGAQPSGETPRPGGPYAAGPASEPSSPGVEAPGSPGTPGSGPADRAPGADAPDAGAADAAGTTGAAASPGYDPQWDAARGTYIVWEPQRQQWLGWDEASKQWRPL